jgi:hypothetical protein
MAPILSAVGSFLNVMALAIDVLCWMRLLRLGGRLTKAELATPRYLLLHAAASVITHARYLILRMLET